MTTFTGFTPDTLRFFKALGFHQNKNWFDENRAIYATSVKQPLEQLVIALAARCAAENLPFTGTPKKSIFRINRDVRFSNNKDPYKAQCSFVLSENGDKGGHGMFYAQIDPTGSYFAAGAYIPETPRLLAFRRAIAAWPERYLRMEAQLEAANLRLSREFLLTRNPQGFGEIDERVVHAIRLKSFTVSRPVADEVLLDGAAYMDAAIVFMKESIALTEFVRSVA